MIEIELPGLAETVYLYTHESGLRCYFWRNEKVNGTHMTLSVKYGSIHTDFKIGNKKYHVPHGVAHFLEHIKFNETEDFTAHDYFRKSGADVNAFTTFDFTSYLLFTTVNQKENLKHLIDFVYNPFFTKKIIQKEKSIIVEEANMVNDDVAATSYYQHLKNIFNDYKYKEIITGEPDDIKAISLEDVLLVYRSFYHPQNMFLCVTGNVNPYEMAKVVDEALENKEFEEFVQPTIIPVKEAKDVVKEYDQVFVNIMNARVRYAVKLPKSKFKDIDDVTLRMIFALILNMNFGSTSDFKEELLAKDLITNLYTNVDFFDEYIVLLIVVETEYSDEVTKRIEEQLNHLDVDEANFNRKMKANIAAMILEYDDIETVNSRIQENIVHYDEFISDYFDRFKSITHAMLQDISSRVSTQNKAILDIKPKKNNHN